MRNLIRVDRDNKRVWVFGWRLHHGLAGLVLTTIGIALMVHDFKDRKAWISG